MGLTFIDWPEPTNVPPQLLVYQFQLAPLPREPPKTCKLVDALLPHTVEGVAVALVGATELVFTVTVTLAHPVLPQVPCALTK